MGTHHPLVVGQSQPRPLLLQTPPSLVSLNVDNAAAPMEPTMTPRPTTSCRPLSAPPPAVSHHITFPFLSQPMPHAPTPTRRIHLSCFDDAHAAVLPSPLVPFRHQVFPSVSDWRERQREIIRLVLILV